MQTAIIAGVVTALGWLVTYILGLRAARTSDLRKAALQHLEAQLEKLYGPLMFLVIEGRRDFEDLLDMLGRRFVFLQGEALPAEELSTWLFWVENAAFPRNDAIQKLLRENTHLMVGAKLPDSYRKFLDHHNSWKINHLRWQKEQTPYSFHSKINWPAEFESDILRTFEELKSKHQQFLQVRELKIRG